MNAALGVMLLLTFVALCACPPIGWAIVTALFLLVVAVSL